MKICETFDSGNTALWARPSGCEATVFGYGSPFYLVNYSMTKTLSRDFPEMQVIQLSIADNQSPHLLSLTNESFFYNKLTSDLESEGFKPSVSDFSGIFPRHFGVRQNFEQNFGYIGSVDW